ncbi:unnamed protein product [Parnassius mnemosyne]|uniref:FP protein C-terminal domain-containing protein n=1 Tax=Parnassius mnemosyne TaxID=213953 RepID=A0AAV1M339_9NEOP
MLKGRGDREGNLIVELKKENIQNKWLAAAKTASVTIADIHPHEPGNINPVYIRETMTKLNKQILWLAKQELIIKLNYKYVWFKKDFVKARKDDKDKIHYLRTVNDVHVLANQKL